MATVSAPSTVGEQAEPEFFTDDEHLIGGKQNLVTIGEKIGNVCLGEVPIPKGWWIMFLSGFTLLQALVLGLAWLFYMGVGVWGINSPVFWGVAIVNFVWWIGIGHAGTLISAILLLMHQKWRTSLNRFAESMTLFAVMCAGIFPLIHMGRPWLAYWLFPFPNNMAVWPQFRSPLCWDAFAVSTYFSVSLLFWYIGLIPDFAYLRDHAKNKIQQMVYGMLAMGWRGSAIHWRRYEKLYLILAGIGTPLVFSVHTIVSFDFAVSIVPLWHATIFPPFFVAGAIFAGFAMVIWLAVPIRHWYGMKDLITTTHLDVCAKIMLGTGLIVSYGYFSEVWMAFYGQSVYEWDTTLQRMFGPYGWSYWLLILTNTIIPQLCWMKKFRTNELLLCLVAGSVHIGMWFERYVIIVTLTRDHLPSSWGRYAPTLWDYAAMFGSLGLFLTLFALFMRFLPMLSITEMRELLPRSAGGRDGHAVMENAK
ncbi:NrfD/PsrC family molybdoenzyme membrane anchor subunit [Limnoglobus roseus]|uniref:Hydrogenase n=1 Tax=Limnoglobus roseus TaxID=2598579 RepID=A0A5C1AE17_9BACT|nr:NrfD/PsrC family molybdoenzyme membrane anchor subunit [Limnoglobus roseus]QEL15364.1 hydrogenase [Limnoglobus roseus]